METVSKPSHRIKKRILITGVTGYLGSHLAQAFVSSGYKVVGLKRQSSSLKRLNKITPSLSLYDIEDLELANFFKDQELFEAIIHTATCYGRRGESDLEVFQSNVVFPQSLLKAAVEAGNRKFINSDSSLPKEVSAYSLSKTHFLDWGKYYARKLDFLFINMKLEHFFGPGDDPSKFPSAVISNCVYNKPFMNLTDGRQLRDFIFIDDVVSAYIKVISSDLRVSGNNYKEFEVGSGKAISVRDFVLTIHKVANSKTILNFGAVSRRSGDLKFYQADTSELEKLGWVCLHTVYDGIKHTVESEQSKITR